MKATQAKALSIIFVILAAASLSLNVAIAQQAAPDTILVNGKIFTGNAQHSYAQALAIRGERIAAVGESSAIKALAGPHTRQIDLGGRVVVPGFNDAHVHLEISPPSGVELALKGVNPSWEEVSHAITEAVAKAPKGAILSGDIGMSVFHGPEATRESLDALAPENPVILTSFTGHASILNSAALAKLGIKESQMDPLGGKYERGSDGRLSGTIREYAGMQISRDLANLTSDAEAVQELSDKFARASKWGITSMQDMSNAMAPDRAIALLEKVPTPIRVRVMRMAMTTASGRNVLEGKSLLKTHPSPFIEVSGTKWMLDGTPVEMTFSPRKAAPLGNPPWDQMFANLPLTFPQGEIEAMLRESLVNDDQLLLHVSGYPAMAALIAAMEATGGGQVWASRRLRVEHGDGIFSELMPKVKELGILVVQNPTHFSLGPPGGPELFQKSQSLKSLLAQGIPVALGSDGPMNPFLNIMLACLHPNRHSEAITVEQAVLAYTQTSAYAEFAEKEKGSLEEGKLADLAVLSQDIFAVPIPELPKTESVLTLVGGKTIYDSGKLVPASDMR